MAPSFYPFLSCLSWLLANLSSFGQKRQSELHWVELQPSSEAALCELRQIHSTTHPARRGRGRGIPRLAPRAHTLPPALPCMPLHQYASQREGGATHRSAWRGVHAPSAMTTVSDTATVACTGIAGNSSTTVTAPPDRPPPPIADEIVDDMVHLINSGLRSNISAHSS